MIQMDQIEAHVLLLFSFRVLESKALVNFGVRLYVPAIQKAAERFVLAYTNYEHFLTVTGHNKTLRSFVARFLDLPLRGRFHGLEKRLDGTFGE